jgi:prepilin-type N-terminal cleavage/methylation domain-containing protein
MHTDHCKTRPAHAFTLLELLVVIAVILVLVMTFLMAATPTGSHHSARQLKDSTQVRGITQALIVWASDHRGSYPLPSDLDTDNFTVNGPAEEKNTTGNILSILIFNGSISPEICISPAESNTTQIQRYDPYEYATPKAAANPSKALWDPAFRGTPDDPAPAGAAVGIGNQSYAHALPFGKRRAAQWRDSANATEAIFGNRGPTYSANDVAPSSAKWSLLPGPLGTTSNTLLIHGPRTTWEGNIAYNDNHVNFERSPAPQEIALALAAPPAPGKLPSKTAPDNLFVNESDEFQGDGTSGGVTAGLNAYLRPISRVIPSPAGPGVNVWRD